ncbi:MAG: hypothetical protein PUP93_19135 [Rhizonema sp. NSF051]|nr:hypothetical protein [Rhizonema sp. NSF051]
MQISSTTLIIISFLSAFYPRIISAYGVPSVINFVHFLVVPFALVVAIVKTPTKDRRQIAISWEIIVGCLLLLGAMLASALLNHAGEINVFLDYTLLAEPFLLLLAIICLPLSSEHLQRIRVCLLGSAVFNFLLACVQPFMLEVGLLPKSAYDGADAVQGVFYASGAGNYVSVSVSLSVAIYYFLYAKTVSIWFRIFCILATFYQLILSDSKQILLVFMMAWLLLSVTKFSNVSKALLYLITVIVFILCFYWAVENVDYEGFASFKWWLSRSELYGPDGVAIRTKTAGIRIVLSYYKSPLNWLFGLGPGHTIGRLGGWVLRDYGKLLLPLGATVHPASTESWNTLLTSWLAVESSMFEPMFTWGGIWGDLGIIGLSAYLYLAYIVWTRLAKDDFSKFLLLTMFVYGWIITQMEEPGQSLTVAILIGLQWHQRQIAQQARQRALQLNVDTNEFIELS